MGWFRGILLAKRDLQGAPPVSWYELQKQWHFSSEGLMPVTPVLVALALIMVAVILVSGWRSGLFRRTDDTPVKVFRRVVRDWGLTRSEISLLIRMARQQQLPSPLTLVLSGSTLDHHARAYAQAVGVKNRRGGPLDSRIQRIRRVLFEAEPTEEG